MENNGLKYKSLVSESIPVEIKNEKDIFINSPKDSWFIAYLDHRVVIGKVIDNKFIYYQDERNDVNFDTIQKFRAFNKDAELYIWRTAAGNYKARLRTDGIGSAQGVVDANQVMFGTEAKKLLSREGVSYSCLTEKRGTEIILPISELVINEKKERLCIHTRSYIGYIEETMQATYNDVRFVGFVKYQEDQK